LADVGVVGVEEKEEDDDEEEEEERSFFCCWRVILLLDPEVAGLEDRGCFTRGIGGSDDEEEEGKECLKAEGFSEASISRGDTV